MELMNHGMMIQHVTEYIRFYIAPYKHKFILDEIEQLIAEPFFLPENADDARMRHVQDLLHYLTTCCQAAQIKPTQWFDILTKWKPKLQRILNYSEFCLGIIRLCEEVNAEVFEDHEIDILFEYFSRREDHNLDQGIIRKRDFQIGLKRPLLTLKRIQWLNHQAHILRKCNKFLVKMQLQFRDMSIAVIKQAKTKISVTTAELESMVSILIKDYITFANCKNVDELLARQEREKQKRLRTERREQRRREKIEEEERRRKAQGEKAYEFVHDLDDLDCISVQSDDSSVASQLELADDISTMSLMDDMSVSTTQSKASGAMYKLHSRNRMKLNPIIPKSPSAPKSPLKIETFEEDENYKAHLNEEEKRYLDNLVQSLSTGSNSPSRVQTAEGLKLSRHVGHTTNEFLEAQEQRSNNIVRHYSIMRRYSIVPPSQDPALVKDGATVEKASPDERGRKGRRGHESNNNSANELIPKAVKQEDWHLDDPEYQRALKHDPHLTPAAFKADYKAFVRTMQDQQDKQMKYYNSITKHFDRRVEQAQKRLQRARKTGL